MAVLERLLLGTAVADLQIKLIIWLIGLPGSGKSTVGSHLARRVDFSFVDTDVEIEKQIGCPIRDYFQREGESSFRDVEELVIARLLQPIDVGDISVAATATAAGKRTGTGASTPIKRVISTGGGAVLRQSNRELLRQNGYVVYLRASPEQLARRLRHDRHRPLLQVEDPLQKLRDLYDVRDPLYRETAHFVVDTAKPSVTALVDAIMAQLTDVGILPAQPQV
jgi:shikimate kinase